MIHKKLSVEWWKKDANKPVAGVVAGLHLIGLLGFFPMFFSWSGVAIGIALYMITGWLGITLCYHRLLTHRSFKTTRWFCAFLILCACAAWEGGPITWVGTHRCHHKESDGEEDPHTPAHGFTWAHILWVVSKTPEFDASRYALDLQKDPMIRWFERFWWLPQILLTIGLFIAGWYVGGYILAVSWVCWGIGIRTISVFHTTWLVNSATHTWGYRNFENTGDNSRNLWWVALLSFGEGWHNNHHKEPSSAAHGMRWFEIDFTFITIVVLSCIGLAWDIVYPKEMPLWWRRNTV